MTTHAHPPHTASDLRQRRHGIGPRSWWLIPVAAVALLSLALVVVRIRGPILPMSGAVESWASITVAITLQAMPFLVLGVIVSGAISAFVSDTALRTITPRNEFLAVPTVASSGLLLPGCECGSVPVSGSLIRRGIPPAAALAFMLAAPAINPVVLVSTAVAFNGFPLMVWARFLASLAAAILVGWMWISIRGEEHMEIGRGHDHSHVKKLDVFRASALSDLMNAGGFLALGAMAAALIKVTVPRSWFETINEYPLVAVAVMAALAIVLSLCSEADAFIAASFTHVSPTAQLVFLVVGPMVDIKLIAMQYGMWGKAFVLRFVPFALAFSILSAVIVGGILFGGL
ncbi:permease [Corynebacterium sp. TAE3-ERU2]|uniref:permease n=1 Tax=Corynebacterium sp. TAE3-ERU2 TaxID=2849497 RepID=UPI001C442D7F|nr:permease [Corynebacterium sp. TAE3-ERU2]MBV7301156.1 permease [Corynebacterium sp. TAE3-ERU2]